MKRIYLDTNVVVKLFSKIETGREQVERIVLLAKQNKINLCMSQWILNEFLSAVLMKKNKGAVTEHEAWEAIVGIADMLEGRLENTNISLYPINEKVVLGSRSIIMETGCHTGDAIHLYTADKAHCDYFVTADKELTVLIRNSKLTYRVKVVDIGEDRDVENFLSNF